MGWPNGRKKSVAWHLTKVKMCGILVEGRGSRGEWVSGNRRPPGGKGPNEDRLKAELRTKTA